MSVVPAPVVILISGRGSNLQAIIDEAQAGTLPVSIAAVISNNPAAAGLERARVAGIKTEVVDHRQFGSRTAFEQALRDAIDVHAPSLVVLAGFMRILGTEFISHYRGRMINIHPSLLPAFPGLDTHARAIESGAIEHGATVHFVTDQVDGGPIIAQAVVPVLPDDTVESLQARVLKEEHRLYPRAIRWFVEGRLRFDGNQVVVDA
jgi:phosphoribosylglycinamide formyltransferase-1